MSIPTYREYTDWQGSITLDWSQGGELSARRRVDELVQAGYMIEAADDDSTTLIPESWRIAPDCLSDQPSSEQ